MIQFGKIIQLRITIIICCIIFISCNPIIDITKYPSPKFSNIAPLNNENKILLSIIETGYSNTLEAFMYRGGSMIRKRRISHIAVLIQHPKKTLVIDTGLGTNIKQQVHDNFNFWERLIFRFIRLSSLKETLEQNQFDTDKIDYIIPTHFHYDHVGGIEEFPKANILLSSDSYQEAVLRGKYMKAQYSSEDIKWRLLAFEDGSYEVFQESCDLFHDGTVVLVKLPGHTKGSLGIFVNLQSGKRYFFIGDLTWANEALLSPSEKHCIPRAIVDNNREQTIETITKVYYLKNEKPEIIIIPAHDANAQKGMAKFPVTEW